MQSLGIIARPQAARTACRFANPQPGAMPADRQSRIGGILRMGADDRRVGVKTLAHENSISLPMLSVRPV